MCTCVCICVCVLEVTPTLYFKNHISQREACCCFIETPSPSHTKQFHREWRASCTALPYVPPLRPQTTCLLAPVSSRSVPSGAPAHREEGKEGVLDPNFPYRQPPRDPRAGLHPQRVCLFTLNSSVDLVQETDLPDFRAKFLYDHKHQAELSCPRQIGNGWAGQGSRLPACY